MEKQKGVYAKDAYRIVREKWKSWFKSKDYRRIKDLQLGWDKTLPNQDYVSVFMQCDRMGWDELGGSRITFQFGFDSYSKEHSLSRRIGYLLTKEERMQALKLNQRVRTQVALNMRNYVLSQPERSSPEHIQKLKSSSPAEYEIEEDRGPHDLWFQYLDEQDVIDIADTVFPALPRMLNDITLGKVENGF